MNILIGPINKELLHLQNNLLYLDYEIIKNNGFNLETFESYSFTENNIQFFDLENILEKISFEPDFILLYCAEYAYIPVDISNSKYPIVSLFMDWNITSIENVLNIANISDHILTDLYGVEFFNKYGYENVSFFPLGGYNENKFLNLDTDNKIYDISFIGSLDGAYHNKREILLNKLLYLNKKYKILVTSGFYNEENNKLVSQSKITFNYSVKKELNMRSYEAMRGKSLLFLEDDNVEVKNTFKEFEDYIPYNKTNLIQRLEYYIKNDLEREKIVESAFRKVKKHTYENHLIEVFNYIKNINLTRKNKKNYLFKSQYSSNQKLKDLSLKMYKSTVKNTFIYSDSDEFYITMNNMGVSSLAKYVFSNEGFENLFSSKTYFERAIELFEDYSLAYLNMYYLYDKLKKQDMAEKYLNYALESLIKEENIQQKVSGMSFFRFNITFRWIWETLYINNNIIFDLNEKKREFLKFICIFALANIEFNKKNYSISLNLYEKSEKIIPEFKHMYLNIAQCFSFSGNIKQSIKYYEKFYKNFPFLLNGIELYFNLLIDSGNNKKIVKKLEQLKTAHKSYIPSKNYSIQLENIIKKYSNF